MRARPRRASPRHREVPLKHREPLNRHLEPHTLVQRGGTLGLVMPEPSPRRWTIRRISDALPPRLGVPRIRDGVRSRINLGGTCSAHPGEKQPGDTAPRLESRCLPPVARERLGRPGRGRHDHPCRIHASALVSKPTLIPPGAVIRQPTHNLPHSEPPGRRRGLLGPLKRWQRDPRLGPRPRFGLGLTRVAAGWLRHGLLCPGIPRHRTFPPL